MHRCSFNVHPADAVKALESGAETCVDAGRHTMAANMWQQVAELHDQRILVLDHGAPAWTEAVKASVAAWKKCGDYFQMGNAQGEAWKARLEVRAPQMKR